MKKKPFIISTNEKPVVGSKVVNVAIFLLVIEFCGFLGYMLSQLICK
jgi:hypothetical protein